MMRSGFSRSLVSVAVIVFLSSVTMAQTTIDLWVTWSGGSTFGKAFVDMAERFNAMQSDVQVNVRAGVANWEEALTVALIAGSGPDVMAVEPQTITTLGPGLFEPLEGYVARDNVELEDFFPALLDGGVIGGHIYGLPYMAAFMGFTYYNVDHFNEAGLPHAPSTWDDFEEAARKLTRFNDGTVVRWGFEMPPGGGGLLQTFYSLALQNGNDLLNGDASDFTWDQPTGIEAWEYLTELCGSQFCNPRGLSWGARFLAGDASMYYGPSGAVGDVQRGAQFEWAVGPPLQNVRPATIGSSWMYAMNADSVKKEAAWQFIRFMVSQEGMLERAQLAGQLPARASVLQDRYFTDDPSFSGLIPSVAVLFGDHHPLLRNQNVFNILVPKLQQLLRGEMAVRTGFEEVARILRQMD